MSGGVCWNCANLRISRKEGDIFWNYQCIKYPRYPITPDEMNGVRNCFEPSKKKKVKICGVSGTKEEYFRKLAEDTFDKMDEMLNKS